MNSIQIDRSNLGLLPLDYNNKNICKLKGENSNSFMNKCKGRSLIVYKLYFKFI